MGVHNPRYDWLPTLTSRTNICRSGLCQSILFATRESSFFVNYFFLPGFIESNYEKYGISFLPNVDADTSLAFSKDE